MEGKLVRDRVPEIIKNSGKEPIIRTITDDTEYMTELFLKLDEEVSEFKYSMDAINLTDILEVVYSLGECYDLSEDQMNQLRNHKHLARGGFEGRTFLEGIEGEASDQVVADIEAAEEIQE